MKPFHSFAMLAAIAAVGQAYAVDATTTPVGYTTTTISAAFSPSSPKNNVIAPNLQNPATFTGTVSAITGDVLTLTSASFTAGAYAPATFGFGTAYKYYVRGTDGYWSQVLANSTGGVTIETGAGAKFTVGEVVTLRRHVTIADYFGATNQVGLQADPNGDPGSADNILLIDEVNGGSITVFPSNVLGGTWITDGFDDAAALPIYPDQGVQVVRRGATDLSLVYANEVDTQPRQNEVTHGVQVRPYVIPVATTLTALGLHTGNPATGLADDGGTADIGQADVVTVIQNGVSANYFYSTLDLGGGAGWYDDSFQFAGTTSLPAGAALVINRTNPTNSSAFIWTVPAATVAP